MNGNNSKRVRTVVIAAIMAAITFIFTYLIKIPNPVQGYMHVGDAVIYIFACILPWPYAMAGAVIGASLSDLVGGYAIFIPATFIIKALYVPFFTNKSEKFLYRKNIIGGILAGVVCVGGYFIYELCIYGWAAASLELVFTSVQSIASAVLFYAIASAFDAAKLKRYLRV